MNAALRELFLSVGLRDQMDVLRRAVGKPLADPAPGTVCEDESAIVGDDGRLYVHIGGNQWHPQSIGVLQLTPPGLARWGRPARRTRALDGGARHPLRAPRAAVRRQLRLAERSAPRLPEDALG